MRPAVSMFGVVVVLAIAMGRAGAQQAPSKPPSFAVQRQLSELDKQLIAAKPTPFVAVKIAAQLYKLQVKATGLDSEEAVTRGQAYASLLVQTGDFTNASLVSRQALATIERRYGPASREVMYALTAAMASLWTQGRYDELEPLQARVVALTKKYEGERSSSYAAALALHGTVFNARSEYTSALRLYQQSLAITETTATDDSVLLGPLQIVGALYLQTNQPAKGKAVLDRVVKIAESQVGKNLQLATATLWGVASQYAYGGHEDLATQLRARVVELYQREITRVEQARADDPALAQLQGQLAMAYRQGNDLVSAEAAFERALAISKQHGQFAAWEPGLAEVKRALNKPKQALVLLEQAQAALSKLSPGSSNAYSIQIADVLRELGDYKRAESLLMAAMANLEASFGKQHPSYAWAQMNAAYLYMASNQLAKAEQMLGSSLEISERELRRVLRSGTEADHAVYFTRNSYQLNTAVNFALRYARDRPTAIALGLQTLLRRKGRVLDAAAANLATIRSKLSADDKRLLDELASLREQFAKLSVVGPTATGAQDYVKTLASLEDQIQRLELSVGTKSAAYRVVTQAITLAAVQKAIPRDARLVEIVSYQPYDLLAYYFTTNAIQQRERRYAAFVIGATGEPRLVDLGPSDVIDRAIEAFRSALADPANQQVVSLGHTLYGLTMAKIAPLLGRATQLLIAPDGALNVVPFAALVDDQQQFLIKRFTFTYLTSGRDLLRLGVRSKAQGGGVMFADPSFDAAGDGAAGAGSTRGRRSSDLTSLLWPPLPGTAKEADEVEKQIKGLTVFRKDNATETALKQIHGPRILHLATHGFFLPDPLPARSASSTDTSAPTAPIATENPLLRSGLALAGANRLISGRDDGILTAMEATGLDLWGTKLVVLSACETGVGKVTNGEGVYGLRRALVIAGAESLVMSLWQVDDEATRQLMVGYYKRLVANKPRSAALRETQLEVATRPGYAHPFYWAAFVPAGANTPLAN
jgi:CHAT domain-containing protein